MQLKNAIWLLTISYSTNVRNVVRNLRLPLDVCRVGPLNISLILLAKYPIGWPDIRKGTNYCAHLQHVLNI